MCTEITNLDLKNGLAHTYLLYTAASTYNSLSAVGPGESGYKKGRRKKHNERKEAEGAEEGRLDGLLKGTLEMEGKVLGCREGRERGTEVKVSKEDQAIQTTAKDCFLEWLTVD